MNITQALVEVRSSQEMADFYGTMLGLPVTSEPGVATVRAGRSTLVFRQNPQSAGCHHFAFTIPSNKFALAKSWVCQRTEVMLKGGQDEFEYEAG